MAPAINSITGQTDQAKKSLATGGNRTGGSNAGILQLLDKSRGAVMDAIGKAKPAAAAGVESTGKEMAGIGLSETGQGLGATTSAASIFSKLADQAIQSRGQSKKIHDDAVSQWADVVSAILFGA
jgi:hypothetical protein